MTKLPIECRARAQMIDDRAKELLESFINGNRKTVLAELCEFSRTGALAILSVMMNNASKEARNDIARFMREMA